MVEVFSTNVKNEIDAEILITEIHNTFGSYKANFDLEDCDKILRVECTQGLLQPLNVINLINNFGFNAEVLTEGITVC